MEISTLYTAKPRGYWIFGGEDGIRTHVPGKPDHLISSQRRYDRFGTSPVVTSETPTRLYESSSGCLFEKFKPYFMRKFP